MDDKLSRLGVFKEHMFINGEWVDSSDEQRMGVTNPATGDEIATVPVATVSDVRKAIDSANLAQKEWVKYPPNERSRLLRNLYNLMIDHKEELAYIMTLESGKVIKESRGEIDYSAGFVEWFSEEAKRTYGQIIPSFKENKRIMVIKQPVGVAGIITPWNFPSAMITRKIAPAIAAGCACVVKPSGYTPLSALALGELILRAGIPEGVYNVVTGKSSTIAPLLLESHFIKKLSFTGSTDVGKHLMRLSADTVKKLSLELGGHAPFIVFDDADIDKAVEGAVGSKFRNSGQTCVCSNRFYIQNGIYDEFVSKFIKAVNHLKVANGLEEDADIGPLIDKFAVEKVQYHIDDAMRKGAKVLTGGNLRSDIGDNFFEPTILDDVNTNMVITAEETFGPVAPLIRFSEEEEAIKQANDTKYGLAAYFYTKDASRLIRVAEALDYGIVGANDGLPSTPQAPFGGVKESGIGREGGYYGMEEYIEYKYISQGL